MSVYLVRRIETKGVLGIFWGSPADVWDAVDELGDPSAYEAARLRPGAIYARDEEPVWDQWHDVPPDADMTPETFAAYSSSEGLWNQITDQKELRWKPLDPADKGVGILARLQDEVG